jgi:hypothetical protein
LVIGGYAVGVHAQPRATKDLDILVSPDAENAKAVYAALANFGAPIQGLKPEDFVEKDTFFRMGSPPLMVDILSNIQGVDFETAWMSRVEIEIEPGMKVPFISSEHLIQAKVAAGRDIDLIDAASIREANKQRELDALAQKLATEDKAKSPDQNSPGQHKDERDYETER